MYLLPLLLLFLLFLPSLLLLVAPNIYQPCSWKDEMAYKPNIPALADTQWMLFVFALSWLCSSIWWEYPAGCLVRIPSRVCWCYSGLEDRKQGMVLGSTVTISIETFPGDPPGHVVSSGPLRLDGLCPFPAILLWKRLWPRIIYQPAQGHTIS